MTTPARRRRWPRLVAAVLAFAVLAMTAVGAGVNLLLGQLSGNITAIDISDQTGETAAPTLVDEETGSYTPLNILLMGSDTRQGKGNKGYGKAGVITGARSDTTILLHVSADRQSAIAVSIPRDTLITLPDCKKSDGSTVGGYFDHNRDFATDANSINGSFSNCYSRKHENRLRGYATGNLSRCRPNIDNISCR